MVVSGIRPDFRRDWFGIRLVGASDELAAFT
jgi:hypothetical protein